MNWSAPTQSSSAERSSVVSVVGWPCAIEVSPPPHAALETKCNKSWRRQFRASGSASPDPSADPDTSANKQVNHDHGEGGPSHGQPPPRPANVAELRLKPDGGTIFPPVILLASARRVDAGCV